MITVSFNCENNNHVLLLTALYDILTEKDMDSSIAALDYVDWLLDEIGSRLSEIDSYDGGDRLSGFAKMVAQIYSQIHSS